MSKHGKKEKKPIYKKWWFWLIILVIIIIFIVIIKWLENKALETSFENIGEGATNFIEGINDADSHLDEFTYNYETGKVEYKPQITIEKYNQIKEGMTQDEVINILGDGEKIQSEGSVGFLMTWGDLNLSNPPHYSIHITFDSYGKVSSKNQLGL